MIREKFHWKFKCFVEVGEFISMNWRRKNYTTKDMFRFPERKLVYCWFRTALTKKKINLFFEWVFPVLNTHIIVPNSQISNFSSEYLTKFSEKKIIDEIHKMAINFEGFVFSKAHQIPLFFSWWYSEHCEVHNKSKVPVAFGSGIFYWDFDDKNQDGTKTVLNSVLKAT